MFVAPHTPIPVIPCPSQVPEMSCFAAGADFWFCDGGVIVRPQPSRPGSVETGDFSFSLWEFATGQPSNAHNRIPVTTNRLDIAETLSISLLVPSANTRSRLRSVFRLYFPGRIDAPWKPRSVREDDVDDSSNRVAVFHWQRVDGDLVADLQRFF